MKTGLPDAVSKTAPSPNWVLRAGMVVIRLACGLSAEGAIDTGCGSPNRAVPRVTTLAPSTRRSTGTNIGEGAGGAVRAAASAGDSMREPAAQAINAATEMVARTEVRTTIRLPAMVHCTPRANISFSICSSTGLNIFSASSWFFKATRRS